MITAVDLSTAEAYKILQEALQQKLGVTVRQVNITSFEKTRISFDSVGCQAETFHHRYQET